MKIKDFKIDNLFNKTWKRILIVFIVVFFIIFLSGVLIINDMEYVIKDEHVHAETILVDNKTIGEGALGDYFVIYANGTTYTILNDGTHRTQRMYDMIDINSQYRVLVRESPLSNNNQDTHIIQVNNVSQSY